MTSPPGPNSLRRDKTCHIRHLGYHDREELERQDVRIDVPGDIQRSGKWVTAAYDILTDSLYPRSTAINIEHKFLALSDLDHILSEEFTEDLLREACQHESGPTPGVKDIHGPSFKSRRKQILATLILIEGVPLIKTFVNAGVFDDALPLASDHPIFTSWKRKDQIDFHSQQYAVLAPFFNFSSDKMRHYVLPLNTRMPFMEPQTRIGRGKDGDIWRTSIHPDHQYWEASKFYGRYFAVKEFSSSNDDEDDFKTFKSEKRALKRFSGPNKGHPHLIRLLLSYQIGERYFMIFQLAESNLKELWKKREVNTEAPDDLTWLSQQCYGVSRGLQKIHRHDSWLLRYGGSVHKRNQNRGRHGDIKPENILCFEQPEPEKFRLVIADFTLMRFHGESSLGLSLARGMAHSPKYRPPELNLSHRTKVNQSYDIWTLGCVFLEFLTWYLLGDQAVYGDSFVESGTGRVLQTFDLVRWHDDDKIYGYQENKFFSLVPNSSAPQVKKSVTQWIKYLHSHENASPPIHRFLTLVERYMLVAEHSKRATIDMVCAELDAISKHCLDNPDTCFIGQPKGERDDEFPPPFTENCVNNTPTSTTSGTGLSSTADANSGASEDEHLLAQLLLLPPGADPNEIPGTPAPLAVQPKQPSDESNDSNLRNLRLQIPQLAGSTFSSNSQESSAGGASFSNSYYSDYPSASDRGSFEILPGQINGLADSTTPLLLPGPGHDGQQTGGKGNANRWRLAVRTLVFISRLRESLRNWVATAMRWFVKPVDDEAV